MVNAGSYWWRGKLGSDLRCCRKYRINCPFPRPLPVAARDDPVKCCELSFKRVIFPQVSRVPSTERCQPVHPRQRGVQHCALRCCIWAPAVLGAGECSGSVLPAGGCTCLYARTMNSPDGYRWSQVSEKRRSVQQAQIHAIRCILKTRESW